MKKYDLSIGLQLIIKRVFDLVVSSFCLIFSIPTFVGIAVAIKLDSRGPVFFRHRRIGKDGRPFDLYKFRTMTVDGDDSTYNQYLKDLIESEKDCAERGKPYRKMEQDNRITRVGRFLRGYYIDELPQFINIIKGDMSLVGPRPHVQLEVDCYTPEQRNRLSVQPGATGLWQVAGKADCTFNELISLDLEYIENWSIWLDMRILMTTVKIFFRGGEKYWVDSSSVEMEEATEDTKEENELENNSGSVAKRRSERIIHPKHTVKSPPVESD